MMALEFHLERPEVENRLKKVLTRIDEMGKYL